MSGRGKASFELPGWRAFIEEKLEEERDLQRPSRLLMKEAGGIAPSGCHFEWSG